MKIDSIIVVDVVVDVVCFGRSSSSSSSSNCTERGQYIFLSFARCCLSTFVLITSGA